MSVVVCPVLPFPDLYWWTCAAGAGILLMDQKEHFEKMSLRNRYIVAGADGPIVLSIPVAGGRQQRRPMNEVLIDNKTNWQLQHWRTLQSVYNRSPYFEFYAPELERLYQRPFERLTEFSRAGIQLLSRLSGLKLTVKETESYCKEYPAGHTDIRSQFRSSDYAAKKGLPVYHQTFEDRTGFLPNLSLLDLLFAEGNNTASFFRP